MFRILIKNFVLKPDVPLFVYLLEKNNTIIIISTINSDNYLFFFCKNFFIFMKVLFIKHRYTVRFYITAFDIYRC